MWAIRIISGPGTGQIYPLRSGKTTTLGRSLQSDVKFLSTGISKEHATIFATEDKLILSDLNSRNGTFVNGVRVQNHKLKLGDKLSFQEVICDILQVPDNTVFPNYSTKQTPAPRYLGNGNVALQNPALYQQQWNQNSQIAIPSHLQAVQASAIAQAIPEVEATPLTLAETITKLRATMEAYIQRVAMPGIYRFAQMTEYRWVLAGFVGIYIFMVTLLATIPMVNLIKTSILDESQRRALTIARSLARANRQAVLDNMEISVNTRPADVEDGVSYAMIVSSKDGRVIAPSDSRGGYNYKTFVNQVRRKDIEVKEQIDGSTVGASVPITYFNAELGAQVSAAHAIVIYNMDSIAMNRGQTFSLFIQTFAIASFLGLILYFLLIHMIEEPLRALNSQLDQALRDGKDDLNTPYRFPRLQELASNINSALTRIGRSGPDASMPSVSPAQREAEAESLVQMMGVAGISINGIDRKIISTNERFDQLIGGNVDLRGRPVADIMDPALRKTIEELLPDLAAQPGRPILSELNFNGDKHEISGQVVMGQADPAYYLVCIRKLIVEEYS
jgi:hypothetical protein